jgi:hypothetical protein
MEAFIYRFGHELLSIFVRYTLNLLSAVGPASRFAALGKEQLILL